MISITRPDPHCLGWVRVRASLWGHTHDHDLDEPVRLSDEVACRIRFDDPRIIPDKHLAFLTQRAGTHTEVRFVFDNGKYVEIPCVVGNLSPGIVVDVEHMAISA